MSALVIKSWKAEGDVMEEKGSYVSIVGRKAGLIAWVLSIMGIDPITKIVVGSERVEFSSSSLAGSAYRLIPLEGICSTYYGYHKPWGTAVSIIVFFAFIGLSAAGGASQEGSPQAAITAFLITIAIGAFIGLIYYFLNRKLTLGFVEVSGVVSGIEFKRSVIENVEINQEQAKKVCLIVQNAIESKHLRMLGR
jgi:hypothetical protein